MRLFNIIANINLRKDLCKELSNCIPYNIINIIDDIIYKWYDSVEIIKYKHALKHNSKIKYLYNKKNIWEYIYEI